eukprot:45010_1
MENICKSTNTDHILQQILQLNELDMEQIQYDIKRNRDVHEFSDMVIEAVDQLLEQTPSDDVEVHTIYSTIAKCFVCDDHYLNDWVCCNCGNYNFSKVINGALHSVLRHCTLCGISHTDSIVFKIRNRPTFVTSYSAIPSDVKDGNQTATNSTDRLIQNIVNKQAIDLCCNERNDNASCPSILRLTHCLIQYKQWMSKVHGESKENEPNTLTVDIGVITNDRLKQIFMDAVDAIQIQAAKVHAFDVDLLMKVFDDNVDGLFQIETFLQTNKKVFSNALETHVKIKRKYSAKLYTTLKRTIGDSKSKSTDFRDIFLEHATQIKHIAQKAFNIEEIKNVFRRNADGIANIIVFKDMKQQTFKHIIKEYCTPSLSGSLYTEVRKRLHQSAQYQQFGSFLEGLDMNGIESDYHHILRVHIHKGDKSSVINIFKFFNTIVHWEDVDSMKNDACRSFKRRNQRFHDMNEPNSTDRVMTDHSDKFVLKYDDKWHLDQYYIQSQLDVIHSHLVHSDWKKMDVIHSHSIHNTEDDSKYNVEVHAQEPMTVSESEISNKNKYVSYGFGVVHEHHRLDPKWHSIYDEMMHNTQCPLAADVFHALLIKAMNKHKIALSEAYKDQLISKYYWKEYNIMRNEPIGIIHILAICIYTDVSTLCTIFRKTYRKDETTAPPMETLHSLQKRHNEFYHFARSLFEAAEFFGTEMTPHLHVFHGLNKEMQFEKFSAYFNQPISCTTSFESARKFSGETGIIVQLTSDVKHFHDASKIPKYLNVAWLSSFPNEEETLFYGSHVAFKIHNIYNIASNKWRTHSKELFVFNKFQQLIENEDTTWTEGDIETLIKYVTHDHIESEATRYSYSLFNHFCKQITWICIQNYIQLPTNLKKILFGNDSLVPLLKLFENLKEIVLNEIDIEAMSNDCDRYLKMVLECIDSQRIKRISFKSNLMQDNKQSSSLTTFKTKASKALTTWSVEYHFKMDNMHSLTFVNDRIEIKDKIHQLKMKEMELQRQQQKWQQIQIEMELDKMRLEREFHDELEHKDRIIQQQRQLKKRKGYKLVLQHIHTVNPHEDLPCKMCAANKSTFEDEKRALLERIVALETRHSPYTSDSDDCAPHAQLSHKAHSFDLPLPIVISQDSKSKKMKTPAFYPRSKSVNAKDAKSFRKRPNRLRPSSFAPYRARPQSRAKGSADTPVPKTKIRSDASWCIKEKKAPTHHTRKSIVELKNQGLVSSQRDVFVVLDESDEEPL